MHSLLHRSFPGYLSPQPHPRFGWHFSAADLTAVQARLPYRISGIGGHRMGAFESYEKVLSRPVIYFTLVRDPIKRYLSHINWQSTKMNMDWSMETFVADAEKDNYQAFRIAGDRYDWPLAKSYLDERFHFVGLLERFDESLLILRQKLGMPNLDIRYERSNITLSKHAPFEFEDQPLPLQERIRKNNAVDQQIYDHVKTSLFPQYISEYEGDLAADLAAFRAENTNYRFPKWSAVKRKGSNFILGRFVQPRVARQKERIGNYERVF